jgi:hypothetical protein
MLSDVGLCIAFSVVCRSLFLYCFGCFQNELLLLLLLLLLWCVANRRVVNNAFFLFHLTQAIYSYPCLLVTRNKRSLSCSALSVACKNSSAFLVSERRLSANGNCVYFLSNSLNNSLGIISLPGCYSTQSRKDFLFILS